MTISIIIGGILAAVLLYAGFMYFTTDVLEFKKSDDREIEARLLRLESMVMKLKDPNRAIYYDKPEYIPKFPLSEELDTLKTKIICMRQNHVTNKEFLKLKSVVNEIIDDYYSKDTKG